MDKNEYIALRKTIRYHMDRYYNQDEPEISDYAHAHGGHRPAGRQSCGGPACCLAQELWGGDVIMLDTVKKLCALSGVTGWEDEVRDYILERALFP